MDPPPNQHLRELLRKPYVILRDACFLNAPEDPNCPHSTYGVYTHQRNARTPRGKRCQGTPKDVFGMHDAPRCLDNHGEKHQGQPPERGETKDQPLELDVFVFTLDCNNCRADPPKQHLRQSLRKPYVTLRNACFLAKSPLVFVTCGLRKTLRESYVALRNSCFWAR